MTEEITATWDEVVSWQRGQIRVPLALSDGRDAVLAMDERTTEALVSQLQAVALGDGDGSPPTGEPRHQPLTDDPIDRVPTPRGRQLVADYQAARTRQHPKADTDA